MVNKANKVINPTGEDIQKATVTVDKDFHTGHFPSDVTALNLNMFQSNLLQTF